MERKKLHKSAAVILVSVIAWGCASTGAALAAPITTAQANADYANSIAAAKASFIAAVRPSRATMIDEGLRAETARRSAVKAGLAKFNALVAAEKASSLAAEKAYKASVAKAAASPTNLTLKAAVKTNLASLTKATTSLSTDAKIAAAHVAFAKVRTSSMDKFKSSLEISANERARTLDRASLRYKADKARAFATLQAALKKASK